MNSFAAVSGSGQIQSLTGHPARSHFASLLVPLCAVALFGTVLCVLCFAGSVEISAALPTAVLITLTALPGIAALTMRGQDLFSPFQLVACYFLLYYGVRAASLQLDPYTTRLGVLEYDDYVPTAAWLAALAFGSFALGYMVCRSPAPANYVLRVCPRLPRRPPIIRLIALAGFGVLAHMYILSYGVIAGRTYTQSGMKDMTENPIPGWLPPCSGLVEIAFCVAVIYAMSSDVSSRDRIICKWFAWICVLLVVFKTVSQGIREYVLLALALWVLCHHYKRRRVGAAAVAVVLASGVFVFSIFRLVRENLSLKTPETLSDVTEIVGSSIESFGSLSASDFANLPVSSVFDRSQGIDSLSLVVKYTPERAPWGLGISYADIPLQLFVPRALWADKPILKSHQDFERTYMGIHFFAQASEHVFADFYSNFAVFGVVIGAFLFGIAFRSFYFLQALAQGRKEILLIYAYLILNAVHKLEADFVAGSVIMVRAMVMVAISLWFLCAVRNHGPSRRGVRA